MERKRFYIWTRTDGTHHLVPDPGAKAALKFWQEHVGGYVEPQLMNDGIVMLCNEDGRIKNLSANKAIPCVVGDVLIGAWYRRLRGASLVVQGFSPQRAQEVFAELEAKRQKREQSEIEGGPK